MEPEDLEMLYIWENDTTLWDQGSTITPYSRYILSKYIAESSLDIYEQKQLRLVIERIEDKAMMGMIDLYDFDPTHLRAGIGILIDPQFHNRGYGKEAIDLMTEYAFKVIHLHQLFAHIPESNKISHHIFEQLDFIQTGVLREWHSTPSGYQDIIVMQKINPQKPDRN